MIFRGMGGERVEINDGMKMTKSKKVEFWETERTVIINYILSL